MAENVNPYMLWVLVIGYQVLGLENKKPAFAGWHKRVLNICMWRYYSCASSFGVLFSPLCLAATLICSVSLS